MFDPRTREHGEKPASRFKVTTTTLIAGIVTAATWISTPALASESSPVAPVASTHFAASVAQDFQSHSATIDDSQPQLIPQAVPLSLLQLRGDYRYALAVDLSANQLYVFANNNGKPELVDTYYATIGKEGFGKQREGDNRTPVGVYRIQEFIDDNALPELYGRGALPLNFPNAWDRKLGRTGHGIWIHGMPRDTERRPPRDSEGCVVVSNAVLPDLHSWSELKSTPVVLADSLRWAEPARADRALDGLLDSVEAWRDAWSSADMPTFLSMHSRDFRSGKRNFASYAEQKSLLAEQRGKVGVFLDEFEVFMYPDIDYKAMAMVSFKQQYSSKQYKDTTYKTQFWQHDGKRWVLQLERSVAPWPSRPINGIVAHAETD